MKKKLLQLFLMLSKFYIYGIAVQCIFLNLLMASDGSAQKRLSVKDIYLDIQATDKPVGDVFRYIEMNTGLSFFYDEKLVDRNKTVSVNKRSASVAETLLEISRQANLRFKQINEVINVISIPGKTKEHDRLEIIIQAQTVTGQIISNDNNEPLPGVNIIEKGTTNGTVTDLNGRFSIQVNQGSTLVFSTVGYVTEEIAVEGRSVVDLVMVPDITQLQELVVVGYGVQKRSDITGSVASVPKERLANLPVTNLMHAIQGTTAGLSITQDSSVPGSSGTMQVRGPNSINADTDPFIVVDGNPFFGLTNDINPNDIESIEVLKDASAVAIYGTRGATGVILITTKRGAKSEKPSINYSGHVGTESIANVLEPMGKEAYVQKYDDFLQANSLPKTAVLPNAAEVDNYNKGITSDWLDVATQPGRLMEHNLSISGGTDNLNYYVSGSNLNQQGVVKGYQFKRTSLRANLDANITSYLKVGTSAFYTDNNYDGGRVNLLEASAMSPYSVPYDENGNYIIYPMSPEQLFLNPMLGLTVERLDRGRNLTGSGYAEITPGFIKGLSYRLNATYALNVDRTAQYTGRQYNDQSGTADLSNTERTNWVVENILSYARDFDKHHFDFTGLYSAQEVNYFRSTARSRSFINDALSYFNIDAGATPSNTSEGNKYTMLSQMARINYSFDSRYLLTLTARRDGYSAFGVNTDKYALFPSMAVGWNIHNEKFMDNTSFLNELKVRASYGKAGNMAIGVNETVSLANTVQWPFGGVAAVGAVYNRLGNADLSWESTTSANLAVDFAILQNRIRGTIETYKSVTRDILMRRNVPAITGYVPNINDRANVWSNLGKMQNVGLEWTLTTVNLDLPDFRWESSLNFSSNKNELLEIYGDGKDDVGNRWFIGHPIRVIYDYEKIGVWQEGEEVSGSDPVAKPGDIKFRDQDNNQQITADDRVILGQRDPKWIGGFTNTFRYKDFHLSIFLQTSQGGMRPNRDLTYADEAGRRNIPADFKYWTPENEDNYWPSLSAYKNYRGYQFAEDYSYIRIKDVRLSYITPSSFLDRYGIEGLTIYLAGRNLYTFTDWFGWDPENNYDPRGSGNWRNNYPLVRTISLGLNFML